jgi:4-amino-4-deoxy-L-arabinose transferase-like glycosyltransferase
MSKNRSANQPSHLSHRVPASLHYVILALGIVLVALVRIRLLDVPLERDEGGFAYLGNLILHGGMPYTGGYDFKPPGLYLSYALFIALFGNSAKAIHLGLLLLSVGSMIFLFLILRRWVSALTGAAATFVFGVLAMAPNVLGFAAHATQFIVFWMLAGYLLLLRARESRHSALYFFSGLSFALSAMMKQQGVLFLCFGIAALLLPLREGGEEKGRVLKRLHPFLMGAAATVALIMAWIVMEGAFEKFWFWNVVYGMTFSGQRSVGEIVERLPNALVPVVEHFVPVWGLALLGGVAFFSTKVFRAGKAELAFLAAAALVAVCLGLEFRSHYFVLLIPVIAMFAGFGAEAAARYVQKNFPLVNPALSALLLLLLCVGYGIATEWDYFVVDEPSVVSQKVYYPTPFVESQVVAEYIQSHTNAGDRVAILGSEPEILFLADRPSATRYLFMYFLMEVHPYSAEMQEEAIGEIEASAPRVVVVVNSPASWGSREKSEKRIFAWMSGYLKSGYSFAGVIDKVTPTRTLYLWGNEVKNYQHAPQSTIMIFQRR